MKFLRNMPKCQKVLKHSKMPLCGPKANLNIAGDWLFWVGPVSRQSKKSSSEGHLWC